MNKDKLVRRQTEKAIQDAELGASDDWLSEAYITTLRVGVRLRNFTADDVWAAGLPKPREKRALGPVFRRLSRDGMIRQTGRYWPTRYKDSGRSTKHNASPVPVWTLI